MAHGDFTMLLPDDEQVYAFTRRLGDVELLVLGNFVRGRRDGRRPGRRRLGGRGGAAGLRWRSGAGRGRGGTAPGAGGLGTPSCCAWPQNFLDPQDFLHRFGERIADAM